MYSYPFRHNLWIFLLFLQTLVYPENISTIHSKLWYRLYESGIGLYKSGHKQEALIQLVRATQLYEKLPAAHTYLGHIYKEKNNMERALYHYQQSLRWNPNQGRLYLLIGVIYYEKISMDNAIRFLQKAMIFSDESAESWFYLGLIYNEKKEPIRAKKYFEKIFHKNQGKEIRLYQKSLTFLKKNQVQAALKMLENAVIVNPAYPDAYLEISKIYRWQKKYNMEIKLLKKVLLIDPFHKEAFKKLVFALEQAEQLHEAKEIYWKIIHYNIADQGTWQEFYNLLKQIKDFKGLEKLKHLAQKQQISIE